MRVKCNLKAILDERDISIRQLAKDVEMSFEPIRRLYNDKATQYQTNTIARICKVLDIELSELLEIVED